jgi:hypothetical protein
MAGYHKMFPWCNSSLADYGYLCTLLIFTVIIMWHKSKRMTTTLCTIPHQAFITLWDTVILPGYFSCREGEFSALWSVCIVASSISLSTLIIWLGVGLKVIDPKVVLLTVGSVPDLDAIVPESNWENCWSRLAVERMIMTLKAMPVVIRVWHSVHVHFSYVSICETVFVTYHVGSGV